MTLGTNQNLRLRTKLAVYASREIDGRLTQAPQELQKCG
jgi:hypothetical protein